MSRQDDPKSMSTVVTGVISGLLLLLVIFLLGVMLSTNVQLTLVMLLLVPMIGLLVTVISRRFRKISHRIQDMMGNVSHVTEEAVIGHRVVKVFRGQGAERILEPHAAGGQHGHGTGQRHLGGEDQRGLRVRDRSLAFDLAGESPVHVDAHVSPVVGADQVIPATRE